MLSTLIYASESALGPYSDDFKIEMDLLRVVAKEKNARLNITGFLFYFDNRFVQILEGDFDAVTSLVSCIRRDRRHQNMRIVWFSESKARAFNDWSMDCSMSYIANSHLDLGVKLRFINRFISETDQQPIMLKDMLVSVAQELQRKRQFPKPRLVA